MTAGVFDFKSIRRSLERQVQKAEFEAKNPKPAAFDAKANLAEVLDEARIWGVKI